MRSPRLRLAAAVAVLLLVGAEVAVRASGVLDYPLYRADPVLGYAIQPGQHGAFLHKHRWGFNSLGMGAGPFTGHGLLLVGDSIVLGGNPVDEPAKLGPQVQQRLGGPVWPISAGSWAMLNELTWIRTHPDVLGTVDQVAIVTNSEDFTTPSVWRTEMTHPTHRPICALCYLAERTVSAQFSKPSPPKPEGPWRPALAAFARSTNKPVTLFLYPKRGEPLAVLDQRRQQIEAAAPGVRVVEVGAQPEWRGATYRDDMHPTDASTAKLAEVIAQALR